MAHGNQVATEAGGLVGGLFVSAMGGMAAHAQRQRDGAAQNAADCQQARQRVRARAVATTVAALRERLDEALDDGEDLRERVDALCAQVASLRRDRDVLADALLASRRYG